MQWLTKLHRLEHDGLAIYIDPLTPNWFVPSTQADNLFQAALNSSSPTVALEDHARKYHLRPGQISRALKQAQHLLDTTAPAPFKGRSQHLPHGALKEIWFHLTDTCNLSCRHCLFGASPAKTETIGRDTLFAAIDQAARLGSHLFYFTGGEPFVYPDFCQIIKHVLDSSPDHHVVVLTNGLLLEEFITPLTRLDTNRLHLQVSLDGLEPEHDFLRGRGSYQKLVNNLTTATQAGLAITLSVAVNATNVHQLPEIARKAHEIGATSS